jgi:hypothetical protein
MKLKGNEFTLQVIANCHKEAILIIPFQRQRGCMGLRRDLHREHLDGIA